MAKMAGVGERSIERAKTIESAGLGDEVRDGKIGATKSAEIAKQGPEAVAKAKAAMAQGQPVEAPAPKPKASKPASGDTESALEAVREELAKVKAEFEDYVENAQETVSLLEDADAELQMLRRIVEAEDKGAAIIEEGKRLRQKVENLEGVIRGLTNEKNAAVRAAKGYKRAIDKLERQNRAVRGSNASFNASAV